MLTGETRKVLGRLLTDTNRAVPDQKVTWTSERPKVVEVDDKGSVTGIAPGDAEIVVEGAGFKVTIPVKVQDQFAKPAKLEFIDPPKNLAPAVIVQLQVRALDEDGDAITLRDTDVRWSTSDRKLVNISQTGKLAPIAAGTVTVTAKVRGAEASFELSVP